MKTNINFLGVIFLLLAQGGCLLSKTELAFSQSVNDGWKNFYAIYWAGTKEENARYAKQMGYDYIGIQYPVTGTSDSFYRNNPDIAGLKFYFDTPSHVVMTRFGYQNRIDTSRKDFTKEEIDFYEQNMVWKSYDPFPNNIATGWWFNSTTFQLQWDFQQQRVIDMVIDEIMEMFHDYHDESLPFTFAGYIHDTPSLIGGFNQWTGVGSNNKLVRLSDLTGTDSGLLHGTITHKYHTLSDGRAAFYKQLDSRMKQEFPNVKSVGEPMQIYGKNWIDEYVYHVSQRADSNEIRPDLLLSENSNTNFVDDDNNFNSGITITKDMVGNSQRRAIGEYENRLIAAKAGISGAWYNWYGRFGIGGTGNMPNFKSITEVYPRLKLVRCVPNWDNLNNVPLADRSWDGSVYRSTKSFASSDVMYSRQPKTGKLFAVFNTSNGVVKLQAGEKVDSVKRVNGYFEEVEDGDADVDILGDEIRLKSGVGIDVDATNGQVKGRGYIFTLSTSTGIAPNVTTGSATDVTSNSATLGGTVNANGLSTTAWFEYGVTSGSYGSKSSAQGVSGSGDTAISIDINGLSAAKTYYYRLVAKNSAGIKYGGERSFTTNPTTTNLAPNPGFETDPMVNYFTAGKGTFTWTADAAYTGSRSLKIVSSQSTGTFARWMSKTTEIGAFAGAYYTASVWMKASDIQQYGKLIINFWDSSLKYLGGYKSSGLVSDTSGWTKLTVQGKALSNAAYLRVEFRLYGPGTLWIDDVTIK